MADSPQRDDIPEDDFPASENTPGQGESRVARGELERWLAQQTEPQLRADEAQRAAIFQLRRTRHAWGRCPTRAIA